MVQVACSKQILVGASEDEKCDYAEPKENVWFSFKARV